MSIGRFVRTVRHLKLEQWLYRLKYKIVKPQLLSINKCSLRKGGGTLPVFIPKKSAYIGDAVYSFLNKVHSIHSPGIWNNKTIDRLWLYNLHYFDDVLADDMPGKKARDEALMLRWIRENVSGTGLEPYPTSLRIVNWIKWCLRVEKPLDEILQSLCDQTQLLSKNLERHILGNHLFANAKALIFAGLFFEGSTAASWLELGFNILSKELGRQILGEGAHAELSPMYHAIILEDVLDLIQLSRYYNIDLPSRLYEVPKEMLAWMQLLTHPDQGLAFFNDTAEGVAATVSELIAYANRLGYKVNDSDILEVREGHARFQNGSFTLIADFASIGADYQPGHAHADSLSFELSVGERRVFVNGGISHYGNTLSRLYERSTHSHNALSIDGRSSSEVWHSFRVGSRAIPSEFYSVRENGGAVLSGVLSGFSVGFKKQKHRREFNITENAVTLVDSVLGSKTGLVNQYFKIAPGLSFKKIHENTYMITGLSSPLYVIFDEKVTVNVRDAQFAKGFGWQQTCQKCITEVKSKFPLQLVTKVTTAL